MLLGNLNLLLEVNVIPPAAILIPKVSRLSSRSDGDLRKPDDRHAVWTWDTRSCTRLPRLQCGRGTCISYLVPSRPWPCTGIKHIHREQIQQPLSSTTSFISTTRPQTKPFITVENSIIPVCSVRRPQRATTSLPPNPPPILLHSLPPQYPREAAFLATI